MDSDLGECKANASDDALFDDERTVFDGERAPYSPRRIRRSTRMTSLKSATTPFPNVHMGVRALWNGQWCDAEAYLSCTKQQNSHNTVLWALCPLYKYVLTSSESLRPEILSRFAFAESKCIQELADIESDSKKSFIRRRVGLLLHFRMKANLTATEKEYVADWNKVQGDLLVCIFVKAYFMYTAGNTVRALMEFRRIGVIFNNNINRFRNRCNGSDIHSLVLATMQMLVVDWPPLQLRLVCMSKGDPLATLDTITDPEVKHYAHLLMVGHLLGLASEEYRKDRSTLVKRAHDLAVDALHLNPTWIMYRKAKVDVYKRLGRVGEMVPVLQLLAPTPRPEALEVELAAAAFVDRNWWLCESILKRMVPTAQCPKLVLMYAASLAMSGNEVESMNTLAEAQDKFGVRWGNKIKLLRYRPHKNTLYYELCYFFGYMKWFDKGVYGSLNAGGKRMSNAWLVQAMAELERMYEVTNDMVMLPGPDITRDEAYEQQVSVAFMCGYVACMLERIDVAGKYYLFVLNNAKTKTWLGRMEIDPWHVPFTHYELGCLNIRMGEFLQANENLRLASRRKVFLYGEQLRTQIAAAVRYLSSTATVASKWAARNDELGVWIAPSSTFGEGSKVSTQTVAANSVCVAKRKIEDGGTLKCTWSLEASNIWFSVLFTNQQGEVTSMEEGCMIEPLGLNEGFYTSQEKGEVTFRWDNTHSKFMQKVVFYMIE